MKFLSIYFLFVLGCFCNVQSALVQPIQSISQGKLKGKIEEARNGRDFVSYLGIPFVKKPERFMEASAGLPPWDGVRDATKFGPPCPQFDRKSKTVIGNEDCLFLNVFTPQIPRDEVGASGGTKTTGSSTPKTAASAPAKKRPVIFYIHGGTFVSQSGDLFGPNYLLAEDVILVTFNYRLSVLGFLSTGDKETVANLALRDQIEALKWVQQNIESFGGDKTRVTLFGGGSAGGAMASYLTLSPLAKGLFSGVISTSGNALCPWAIVRHPEKIAPKLAAKLNCPNLKSSKEILVCLKGKSIKDIEIARVSLQGFNEDPAVPFGPVVETWLAKDLFGKAVIADQPLKLMREGKFAQVPWLTGVNSLNGINLGVANVVTTPKRLTQLDENWTKLAPIIFHFSQTAPNPGNVSEQIRDYYFGTKNVSVETRDQFITALTDRNFVHCTAKAASIQSKFAPVFLYNLEYVGASSFIDDWGLRDKLNVKGVVHGDELQHIFNLKLGNFPVINKENKHYPFSEKMVKLVTSFALNGKPVEIGEKVGAEWSPVLPNLPKSGLQWYKLDSASLSRPTTFHESRMSKLWDTLDLGESSLPGDGQQFAVGYEFFSQLNKASGKPSPITPTQATKPVPGGSVGSSSVKPLPSVPTTPQSKGGASSATPIVQSYGLSPSKAPTAPSTAKPLVTPASVKTEITPGGSTAKPLLSPALVKNVSPGASSSVTFPSTAKPLVTPGTEKDEFSPVKGAGTTTGKPLGNGGGAQGIVGGADKPEPGAPVLLSVVFKDDDPYLSTSTTTTTKKPGFFSKLLG